MINTRHPQGKKLAAQPFDITKTKHLLLEGPGVRFFAYIYLFERLKFYGLWDQIEDIAASSGAGVIALLAALDYSTDEMLQLTLELNEIMKANSKTFANTSIPNIAYSILTQHGLNDGEHFENFVKRVLKRKGLSENLTFAQFANECRKNPRFKDFILTGSYTTREGGIIEYFCSKNPRTRNVPIAKALPPALGYPGIFKPAEVLIDGKLEKLRDGGVRDNYPLSYFPVSEWAFCFGIKLDTLCEMVGVNHIQPGIVGLVFQLITNNDWVLNFFGENTAQIFDCRIPTEKSDLTLLDVIALCVSGFMAVDSKIQKSLELKKQAEKQGAEGKQQAEEKTTVETFDQTEVERKRDERTSEAVKLIRNESVSNLSLFRCQRAFKKAHDHILEWETSKDNFVAHYNVLIDVLNEKLDSISSVLVYFAVFKQYQILLELLIERGIAVAKHPDAKPILISDIIIACLQNRDYQKARDLLVEINRKSPQKLLEINHNKILELLDTSQDLPSDVEKIALKKSMKAFVENLVDQVIKTCPGAYPGMMVQRLNTLLKTKKYSEAKAFLPELKQHIPKSFHDKVDKAASQQVEPAKLKMG